MSAVAVAPINLSALPTDSLPEFIEAREIARALRGWEPQTDIITRNGQTETVVRTQRRFPHLPIYFKPGSTTHFDVAHGYVYEFTLDDVVLENGRGIWELFIYYVGTPTERVGPVQVFTRQYTKADHRPEQIRDFYMKEAIDNHSTQRTFEWANSAAGKAKVAAWNASEAGLADAATRLPYVQRDLETIGGQLASLRRAYKAACTAGDNVEAQDLLRRGRNCRLRFDGVEAEVARLNTLVSSPFGE